MTEQVFKYFKDYLDNMEMEVFMKRGARIQALLREVPGKHIQRLHSGGQWYSPSASDAPHDLHMGAIYRVNPDWEGPKDPVEPAKPSAPRYIDKKPYLSQGGDAWYLCDQTGDTVKLREMKTGFDNVLGFVYGTSVKRTIRLVRVMDVVGVAGYEIVVPDAVRFRI